MKTQENQKWYWVSGDHLKGFKIHEKQPKHKFIREPFRTLEQAKRFIDMEFLLNA